MDIFCVDMRGADAARLRCGARSRRFGSAFGVSLLAYAVEKLFCVDLPEIAEDGFGKPFFPKRPDVFFSLSHGKTHAVCAVSDSPVGVDVETLRPLRGEGIVRPEFFERWVLSESVFKLTQQGNLRTMRFEFENGGITAPVQGVLCRLYSGVPGCALAAAAYADSFPDAIENVEPRLIYT